MGYTEKEGVVCVSLSGYNRISAPELLAPEKYIGFFYTNAPRDYDGREDPIECWQIFYLRRGEIAYALDGKTYELREGDLIMAYPFAVRHARNAKGSLPCEIEVISFFCSSEKMNRFHTEPLFHATPEIRELVARIFENWTLAVESVPGETPPSQRERDCAPEGALSMLHAEVVLLLQYLYRLACTPREIPSARREADLALTRRIRAYLWEKVGEEVTQETAAHHFGISCTKLRTLFREYVGCGLIEYFLYLKTDRAKTLLAGSDLSVTEIAERTGFSSVHYFSRIFRQRTGLTPSQWRTAQR